MLKIKKITALELGVVLLLLVSLGIYYSPYFMNEQSVMKAAKIKADNAIFTSKVLEEFSSNNKIKSSQVAQMVSDELNLTMVNPYNKKEKAYTFESNCKACNSIEVNDDLQMIILTSYDKRGDLVARTVIKPPSFVTYNKED